MTSSELVPLRDYADMRIEALRERHNGEMSFLKGELDRRFADLKEQIEISRVGMENRLDGMNEFRQSLADTTGRMVERTLLDQSLESVHLDIKRVEEQIDRINTSVAQGRGRQAAYASALAVIISIVSIVVYALNGHIHA